MEPTEEAEPPEVTEAEAARLPALETARLQEGSAPREAAREQPRRPACTTMSGLHGRLSWKLLGPQEPGCDELEFECCALGRLKRQDRKGASDSLDQQS